MATKEYLSQAYRLDQRIDSKCEQIVALRALAAKATAAICGMPTSGSKDSRSMESTVCRIADMEAEINADIEKLLDLKQEIRHTIDAIEDPVYKSILELRYLCFKSWEEIADRLGYDLRYVLKLHGRALRQVKIPPAENEDTKRH